MKHYAIYDNTSGALICVGKTVPNPLDEGQRFREYPDVPPHPTFWDQTARDFIVSCEIPDLVRRHIQALTDPTNGYLFEAFLKKLTQRYPTLNGKEMGQAMTRASQGRMTWLDYQLIRQIQALNPYGIFETEGS